jgi:hypothetical protein
MSVRIVFSRGLSANESTSLLLLSGASAVAKAASPLDVALAQASLNDRAGLTKTAAGNNHDLSSNGLVNGHHQEGMGALPQAGAPAAAALSSDVYVVPDPAIRRARALFPCIDAVGSLATYDISVTVPPGLVAVCGGELRENELSLVQLPGGGGEVGGQRMTTTMSRTHYGERGVIGNWGNSVTKGQLKLNPVVGSKATGAREILQARYNLVCGSGCRVDASCST